MTCTSIYTLFQLHCVCVTALPRLFVELSHRGNMSPQLTRDLNNSVCLPVDGHGDRHVDGGGHEGVGRRVEERHQDGICAPLVDLKVKILRN